MNLSAAWLSVYAKRGFYAGMNHSYLNMEAIYSDETEYYMYPNAPNPGDNIKIKIRTALNDADDVFLHFYYEKNKSENQNTSIMKKIVSDRVFDFYEADFFILDTSMRYFFSLVKNKRVYYYNKNGICDELNSDFNFLIIPGFSTPDWAKGAVMYQIFVDRFYNGDLSNDVVDFEYAYLGRPARSVEWTKSIETDDFVNFYGGDLQGVIEKLPYIKSLGTEAIYLNPINVSPSNHKYDIQDYDYVDPHFGVIIEDGGQELTFEKLNNRYATKYKQRTTSKKNLEASNKLFVDLVEAAHSMGIKIILDGVFNHCGSYNKWLDKGGFYKGGDYPPGAYRDARSPYREYFVWFDSNWPNNDCYDGWWGNDNHPKLNYEESPELYKYILDIAAKWVSPPYNADGWRLDVAADLGRSEAFNHQFWRDFRKSVKSANPEAIIIAEHYGDATPWLSGGEWDTFMNYDAFMMPLTWFLTGIDKHSENAKPHLFCNAMAFETTMRHQLARLNIHAMQTAMNELSNHDHSRFLTRTNRTVGRLHTKGAAAADTGINKAVMMEAVVFQMTWPGAPTIYYGDEAGLSGWTDPDNRRPFPWGEEDQTMTGLHKELTKIRGEHPMLKKGSVMFLWSDYGILSFARWDAGDCIVTAINNNAAAKTISLPVWKAGATDGFMSKLLVTYGGSYNIIPEKHNIHHGCVSVSVPGQGGIILSHDRK
ncbi:MAG: glycoside hydrolase family 13 protein [Defluviitaleaceae bacterium]|nr:glycoside hydrolase family 13 protein [Defluviitaleaceae bacterium]